MEEKNWDFASVLMIVGAIFGIVITVAALQDPNTEGPVYIFLPTIIFGVIGLYVGMGIDKLMKK
jgi:hypothetical protein